MLLLQLLLLPEAYPPLPPACVLMGWQTQHRVWYHHAASQLYGLCARAQSTASVTTTRGTICHAATTEIRAGSTGTQVDPTRSGAMCSTAELSSLHHGLP